MVVSLLTTPISISESTCCPPGTRVCRIPLGKLLKQLLVSIWAQKRVCMCVLVWLDLTITTAIWVISARNWWQPVFTGVLKKFDVVTEGSDRESTAANAATEMFLFSSYFSILLKAHFICVSWICVYVCVCVLLPAVFVFAVPSLRYPPVTWQPVKAWPIWPIRLFISVPAGNIRGTTTRGPDENDLSVNELLPDRETAVLFAP